MADLFDKQQKDIKLSTNVIETHFLQLMAWHIGPIAVLTAISVFEQLGVSKATAKNRLSALVENKKLKIIKPKLSYGSEEYELDTPVLLETLWQMREEYLVVGQKYANLKYVYPRTGYFREEWRNILLAYAATGKCPVAFPRFQPDDFILNVCAAMAGHTGFQGLFAQLPSYILNILFQKEEKKWMSQLEQPDEAFIRKTYLEDSRINEDTRTYFKEAFSFYEYVLQGRINEIPDAVTCSCSDGLCAHALYHQYHGRNKEAVSLYQRALKQAEGIFFFQPFYDAAYVLALISEGSASTKKKLEAIAKKKDLAEYQELIPARLLVLFSRHEQIDNFIATLENTYILYSPLLSTLIAWLMKHYQLTKYDLSYAEKIVKREHLKLFQFEYSQDFPAFKECKTDLSKKLGISPLLPAYTKLPDWENTIQMLMEKLGGSQEAATDTGVSQSRIVYHLSLSGSITPRLQKSKDGVSWTKGRNMALSTFKQGLPEMNETDLKMSTHVKYYSGSGWGSNDYWELDGVKALAVLVDYPLVFQAENPDVPIVITKEEPQIIVTKSKNGYKVTPNVTFPIASKVILKKENDQLYRITELNAKQHVLLETLSRTREFPECAKDQLVVMLAGLGQCVTVHSDLIQQTEELKKVKGDSTVTVQLQPLGDGIKVELFIKPLVEQPPYCKAGEGAGSVIGMLKGKRVQVTRNLKKESENFGVISKLLQRVSGDKTAVDVLFFDDYYQCLDLIEALREQTKIARTEWPEGVKFSVKSGVDFQNLNLSLQSAGQWFEVEGELTVDERTRIKIRDLLQKVRESKGRFIALNDSDFLALSQQLRRQLEEMDAMLLSDKGKLRVSRLGIASLSEMEKLGVSLKKDKGFRELQTRIENTEKQNIVIPKNLQAELRSYQVDGFRWMSRLAYWGAGACLADDMGLGKTIQAIALMLSRGQQGASLVIAPASVLLNWKAEINRFAPSLTPVVIQASEGNREELIKNASGFDVVLTTYGLLINASEQLAAKEWNVIILDEAHTIKNKDTKMSKAAMELKGGFRLLLTGTPLQNHLGEIWNLFQFANPGLLGSFQQFNENFIVAIEKNGNKQRQKQLKKMLLPFLLRRTKSEVLDELPEKTEVTLLVELSPEERALYENLREQAVLNVEEGTGAAIQALAEITRLRQAACHPALVNKELNLASSKTQAFLKLTDDLIGNNHRALVFSQFTSHLALIRQELDKLGIEYLYLDGGVSVNERAELVKKFQSGEQPLFLISLKAGGTGLNLTAADYVIHLDPWWNPAVEDQASDRVYRIGQTRPVTIYRLIAAQTIEEKIIRLHQTKKSLADSLLDGSDMAHKLTKEEMLDLLRDL